MEKTSVPKTLMRRMSCLLVLTVLAIGLTGLAVHAFTPGQQLWARRYDGPGHSFDYPTAIAIDKSGNVYVTGGSVGSATLTDYLTIKYSSKGNQQWTNRYDGPKQGNDVANDIAVDESGNVYVTGRSLWPREYAFSDDYITIKYDTNGTQKWAMRYAATNYDEAKAIAVDKSGNVYVTGRSQRYSGDIYHFDYATVKYDTSGVQQWAVRYDGLPHLSDEATAIAVDSSGNVYVTGTSAVSSTNSDYATIKYDTNGNRKWVKRYDGPGHGSDYANAIAVDASGNVHVTGRSPGLGTGDDFATVKYDTDGVIKWSRRYDGPIHGGDMALALALDSTGNVYVTGTCSVSSDSGASQDFATVKHDVLGKKMWVKRYDGPSHGLDWAVAVAVDSSGNAFVTGRSNGLGNPLGDYATIKYAP